jgi:hypothetical protein
MVKRRKDKTHLLAEWRLKFMVRYHVRVYVWDSRAAMLANVHGLDENTLACFVPNAYFPAAARRGGWSGPKLGEVHVVAGEMGVGVVTHELTHACFHWGMVMGLDFNDMLYGDNITKEELFCWEIGSLATQFWQRFYDWQGAQGKANQPVA